MKYASIDIEPFLSERARAWKPSAIRELFPLQSIPGMLSLLSGTPHPKTLPFEAMSFRLKPIAFDRPIEVTIEGDDLVEALQYGPTAGVPRFVKWLKNLQCKVHGRSLDEGWAVAVGTGSQDLMYKTFQSLTNAGHSVLFETPSYSGALGILRVEPCSLAEVQSDAHGLNPDALREVLSTWHKRRPGQCFPNILYTVPTGNNPTGASKYTSGKKDANTKARQAIQSIDSRR